MTSHLTDTEDLPKRLREHVEGRGGPSHNGAWQMMLDAADAIETLTKERDEARAESWERTQAALAEHAKVSSLTAENERLKGDAGSLEGAAEFWKHNHDEKAQQLAEARKALEEVVGCFEAARVEGLNERLAELSDNDVGSLHDLYVRRLSFAETAALAALPPETTGEKRHIGRCNYPECGGECVGCEGRS
jgi:hypothetical protein